MVLFVHTKLADLGKYNIIYNIWVNRLRGVVSATCDLSGLYINEFVNL